MLNKGKALSTKTTILFALVTNIKFTIQAAYLKECSIRYNVVHFLNHTCEEVYAAQPLCKNTLDIAYYSFPPYIFQNKSGDVQGLLPGFFQKFYIDTCCLGCGKVRYLPAKSRRSAIMDQLSPDSKREVDIMLPIQNSRISMMYFGKPFTETVQVDFIFYTGVLDEVEPANKMTSLFKSLVMTWPLLLMTMSMAVGAGALVWVLDGRFNEDQFPPNFPNGLLEGIWWAFISMTTVGYGDRTPSSAGARVFAVFWIFFGITFFAMYLGTITSVMTKNLQEIPEFEISGKKVGILSWNNAAKQSLVVSNGIATEFDHVEQMIDAFKDNKIHAIAMDPWMTKYYLPMIRRVEPRAAVQMQIPLLLSGIGFLSKNKEMKDLCDNFLRQNSDNANEIWTDVAKEFAERSSELLGDKDIHQKYTQQIETMFTYKHISFPICLISMLVLVCLCVFTNAICNRNYITQQNNAKNQNMKKNKINQRMS